MDLALRPTRGGQHRQAFSKTAQPASCRRHSLIRLFIGFRAPTRQAHVVELVSERQRQLADADIGSHRQKDRRVVGQVPDETVGLLSHDRIRGRLETGAFRQIGPGAAGRLIEVDFGPGRERPLPPRKSFEGGIGKRPFQKGLVRVAALDSEPFVDRQFAREHALVTLRLEHPIPARGRNTLAPCSRRQQAESRLRLGAVDLHLEGRVRRWPLSSRHRRDRDDPEPRDRSRSKSISTHGASLRFQALLKPSRGAARFGGSPELIRGCRRRNAGCYDPAPRKGNPDLSLLDDQGRAHTPSAAKHSEG